MQDDRLAKALFTNPSPTNLAVRFGEIVSDDGATVTLSIGGGSAVSGIRYLDSYNPSASDVVVCIQMEGTIFVLGTLA